MKTLVFAGSTVAARTLAVAHGLRPRDYVYVSSPDVVRGCSSGVPKLFDPSFVTRRDIEGILTNLAICDLIPSQR